MSISLRPLRPSDWKAVEAWVQDPEVTKWMVFGRTAPSAQRWCQELADGWPRSVTKMVVSKGTGAHLDKDIGIVGLYDIEVISRKAELRILLGPNRGKGAGTEATRLMVDHGFNALNLHRIWLGTAEGNVAARKCFTKAGFRQEGILQDDFWLPEGGYMNNVRMGIVNAKG